MNLKLSLLLQAIDKATAPTRKVVGAVVSLGQSTGAAVAPARRLAATTAAASQASGKAGRAWTSEGTALGRLRGVITGAAKDRHDLTGATQAGVAAQARSERAATSNARAFVGLLRTIRAVAPEQLRLRAATQIANREIGRQEDAANRARRPVNRLAAELGSLRTRLGNLANTTGLDRIGDSARRSLARVGGVVRTVGLVTGAAATAGAVGLWRLATSAANAGDEVFNNAQKVGVGVVPLQRLNYAAKLANSSNEELGNGMKFLAINARSAAQGGKEDAEAFKALGVDLKDAHGKLKPVDEILISVSDRFAGMPDGIDKTALAVKLFGRAGVDMIPLLNMGSKGLRQAGDEAERFGLVMSAAAAAGGDDFNDRVDRMRLAVAGLKLGIGTALLPVLGPAITRLTDYIAAHRPELIKSFIGFIDKAVVAVPKVMAVMEELVTKVDWGQFAVGVVSIVTGIAQIVEAFGGIGKVFDLAIVAWIGQVALAIGSALVPALAAMGIAVGPVLLVVAAVAALAAGAFLLYRNWGGISAWFGKMWSDMTAGIATQAAKWGKLISGLWSGVKSLFAAGVKAVWDTLPPWFRGVLTGAAFVVKVATGAIGKGPETAAKAAPTPLPRPVRTPALPGPPRAVAAVARANARAGERPVPAPPARRPAAYAAPVAARAPVRPVAPAVAARPAPRSVAVATPTRTAPVTPGRSARPVAPAVAARPAPVAPRSVAVATAPRAAAAPRALTPSGAPAGTPRAMAQAQPRPQSLTGSLAIHVTSDGQARVTSARTNQPDLRVALSRGPVSSAG